MSNVRLLSLAMAMTLSVASSQAQQSTDFYPLVLGSKWVYKTGDITVETKVAEVKDGAAKIDTYSDGKRVASETIEVRSDGVYRTKINGTNIEPAIKFLAMKDGKPEANGVTWKVQSKVGESVIKGEFTIQAEKVKVPAGVFDAVVAYGPDFDVAGSKTSLKYWFVAGKGIVKIAYTTSSVESALELKESDGLDNRSGIAGVELDKDTSKVEATSEVVELDPGVVVKISRSRTVEHETSFDSKASVGGSVEGKTNLWIVEAKAKVKAEIEAKTGKVFKQSEKLEQQVTVKGDKALKYRLTWTDTVRTGRVKVWDNGTLLTIPFVFREWSELKVKGLKD